VLSVFDGVNEANVYGVQVPIADGRAGMAAICVDRDINLDKLYKHVNDNLPSYAQPVFLRTQKEIEITGTFKHRKVELVKEGFDPSKIDDPIYFNDHKQKTFVQLDDALYHKITKGEMRL